MLGDETFLIVVAPLHPRGAGWASGKDSVRAKFWKQYLYEHGFVHGGIVILNQEKAFRKLLPHIWKHTIV